MTLLRRLIPAIPWIPWVPVMVMVGLLAWAISELQPDFAGRQIYLRAGLLLAALGVSFVFDDPAAATTDPVPSPLRQRRSLRVLMSLVPWATTLAILLRAGTSGGLDPVLVLSSPAELSGLPVGRLLLEAATMATWGLAVAAVIASRWDDEPGRIASATLLVLYASAWLVPEQWKPWADPADSRWQTAHSWWWAALALGATITIVSSWDSRRRSLTNRLGSRATPAAIGSSRPAPPERALEQR